MRDRYDLEETKYMCRRCGGTPTVEDWCPSCEDIPFAYSSCHAEDLPQKLLLAKDFVYRIVPEAEPSDVESWNVLFRPYTKRSFLRQYIDWVKLSGSTDVCDWSPNVTVSAKFDLKTQQYTKALDYRIQDNCAGSSCQFLAAEAVKPEVTRCQVIELLCDLEGTFGLCETYDEAKILENYLKLTGSDHFPMLIPQVSILSGKRRPDFICFIPLSKFQYEKLVVLVDRPRKDASSMTAETAEYKKEGYLVKRLLIDGQTSYFKMARALKLFIQGYNLQLLRYKRCPSYR